MKINFFLCCSFLLLLIGCTNDSNELDSSPENSNNSSPEEVVEVTEKEDVTEEMVVMPNENQENPVNTPVTEVIEEDELNENQPVVINAPEEEEAPNSGPRVLTQAEEAQLNFATTSIFDLASSSRNSNAKKWNSTINLFLSGDFGTNDINLINNFIEELNSISSNINMNIVSTIDASNVEIYFATRQEYISDRPNFIQGYTPTGSAVGRANTRFGRPSYFIFGEKIWVDTSANNFESVVKHEILHILGLDHTEESDSILFPTPSANPELSANDIFTIKTLYNPLLEASFTQNEVITTVENNIEAFFN